MNIFRLLGDGEEECNDATDSRSVRAAERTAEELRGDEVADCIVDVNPATGEIIDRVRVSTKAEVDKAIEGARKAQPAWNTFSLAMRTSMVKDAVKKIGVDKAGLAKMKLCIHHADQPHSM